MDLLRYFFKAYPYRTIFVFLAVSIASVITAITLLALPALLSKMVGKGTSKARIFDQFFIHLGLEPTLENFLIFLIIGILLQNIILAGANIFAGFTVAKIVKDLRIKLLSAMSRAEWSFIITQPTGAVTASLINEAEQAGNGYRTSVEILSSAIQIIAYLTVAFLISWEIAVVAIVTSLILTLLFGKFISISKQLGAAHTILVRNIISQLTDSTRSIKSLKAMARESHTNAILDSFTKKLKAVNKRNTTNAELLDMLQEIVLMSAIIFTIYLSFEYLDIPLEYGIVLVILYLRSMKLFGKTQKKYQAFVGNIFAYQEIVKSIDIAQKNHEKRTGTKKHSIQGDIRIDHVSFSYDNKAVLKDASATIYHNKLNTIVGPSGVGKTTLVDLICGLYTPTTGKILIDDVALSEMDIRFWRQQIGYVLQEHTLLNTSIKQNIVLGDDTFSNEQVKLALKKAHADTFIKNLPLDIGTPVGMNGANLSGGQRQRLLIARAIVHSPRLLILDEATSALDSETERSLSMVFKELSNEMTIISISHRPAMIDVSDHIIEFDGGKLKPVVN